MKESILDVLLYLFEHYFTDDAVPPPGEAHFLDREQLANGPLLDELDLDDLKWVVLMVLFNQPGSEAAYAWMETQMFLDEPEPVH